MVQLSWNAHNVVFVVALVVGSNQCCNMDLCLLEVAQDTYMHPRRTAIALVRLPVCFEGIVVVGQHNIRFH